MAPEEDQATIEQLMQTEGGFAGKLSSLLEKPADLRLSIEGFDRGIDNYRIDVQLSPSFSNALAEIIDAILGRAMAVKSPLAPKDPIFEKLRNTYADMQTVLIHRTRTDLTIDQVNILQYAIVKYILLLVRRKLVALAESLKLAAANQRDSGSARLLDTHDKIVWLNRHYASILYRTNQQIFRQLIRVESTRLRDLRPRYLEDQFPAQREVLFNPLLQADHPEQEELLIDQYALWGHQGARFESINDHWEQLLERKHDFSYPVPIRSDKKVESRDTAVFDELKGLLHTQKLLGTAEDQGDRIKEFISWMEEPDNIRSLFDDSRDKQRSNQMRKQHGLKGWWQYRSQRSGANYLLFAVIKYLKQNHLLDRVLASYELRHILSRQLLDLMDPQQLCDVVAGRTKREVSKGLEDALVEHQVVIKQLHDAGKQAALRLSEANQATAIRILTDLSRYRLHLKYYRFAHRIFNRIAVLERPEDIKLSLGGQHLYRLFSEAESGEIEEKIIHHAIIKADVRGSTTVTDELARKGLNPAAYFSQRFFEPITSVLKSYGAGKVFIEGDAVILSLLEHDQKPQHWFAVARACGLAVEIINIVKANNAFSRRTGVPVLEIGAGICFLDAAPVYLYDEGRPIMISSAIGLADRLSSCSWKLREQYQSKTFNVEVCRIVEGDGSKGQQHERYNVNGILLGDEAFRKLQSEVELRRVNLKLGDEGDIELFCASYPDALGKLREIVIRKSRVGLWKNNRLIPGEQGDEYFFEVVTHQKILAHVTQRGKESGDKASFDTADGSVLVQM